MMWVKHGLWTLLRATFLQFSHAFLVLVIYTEEGNINGASCIFPFYYDSKLYLNCVTTSRGNSERSRPWCATANSKGNKSILLWGYCLPKGMYILPQLFFKQLVLGQVVPSIRYDLAKHFHLS